MTPSQKVVEHMQKISTRYPNSTVYISAMVTLILILQIITLVRSD